MRTVENRWKVYHERMAFARWLKGGKCERCGRDFYLQFHHREPETKRFEIRNCLHVSFHRLILEIKKCDLLCIYCHQRLHDKFNAFNTANKVSLTDRAETF